MATSGQVAAVAGRPTKLTPATQAALTARLREGQTLATAAKLAGIHRDTLHDWLRRGEAAAEVRETDASVDASEVVFLELFDEVEVARAEAQAAAVLEVRAAGQAGSWQASKWYLERSFPEEWGAKSSTAVMVSASQSSLSEAIKRGRELRESVEASAAATDAEDPGESATADTEPSP
jgi:hypothetical protein